MGNLNYCKYYYINNNSEDFIRAILTTSCLLNLNYNDFDKIVIKNSDSVNMKLYKHNYEISYNSFNIICKQIYNKLYFRNKEKQDDIKGDDFYDQDLVKKFLYGLYDLINFNNKCNSSILRLIMLPFNFYDKKLSEDQKYKILFNTLKIINFSENNRNYNNENVLYSIFLENFNVYLALILSGFTKIIYDNLHENNSEELIRKEILYNLENYFTQDNINNFYIKISKEFRKKIEMKKNLKKLSTLDEVEIDFEMFNEFCSENNFIIEYFELRKEFILFAKTRIKNKDNLNEKDII